MPRHHTPGGLQLSLDTPLAATLAAAHASVGWIHPTRWFCLVAGHDDHFGREQCRLFLRCGVCGRCTRGWPIGTNPPRVTAPHPRASSVAVLRIQ